MALPYVEKPRITEIQVRMDCNGCVQKIRRALQTVQGIYKVHEDFAQQKIIVVGWADPDKVMKAIKKAGKIAKLCSHITPGEECTAESADAAAAPSPSATTVTENPGEQNNQTVTEANAAPAAAPTGEEEPPPAEVKTTEEAPPASDPQPPENSDAAPPQAVTNSDLIVVPPPEICYMNIEHSHSRQGYLIRNGLDAYHVAQEYVREADYREYTRYTNNYPDYVDPQRRYQRGDQYYNYNNNNGGGSNSNGNSRQLSAADSSRFATMFSDENPNACRIA